MDSELLVRDDGPLGSHPEDVTTVADLTYFRLCMSGHVERPAPMMMEHAEPGYVRVSAAL